MRRCVALTAVTGMLVVGLPAVAVADATETVEGELQRLAIERLDGTGLEVAVVVAEDGEVVRVDAEAVEHVETGATVAAEVIPDAQAAEDVLSDDGGVEVADVDVLVARCMNEGLTVGTWEVESDWVDVGTPADLGRARGE